MVRQDKTFAANLAINLDGATLVNFQVDLNSSSNLSINSWSCLDVVTLVDFQAISMVAVYWKIALQFLPW